MEFIDFVFVFLLEIRHLLQPRSDGDGGKREERLRSCDINGPSEGGTKR